ncbi:MAG: hypothetical protein RLZZ200_564 [Pseudomonadota bacterium]|jgi:type II secretory pathway pseudopilin PulG
MNRQRGISLIVVLIALIIISFAATALLRSVDTATLITGNLAFKKAALASGDAGSEAAIAWLTASASGTTLHSDRSADGYYATSADACDLTGSLTPDSSADNVAWTGTNPPANCNMVARQAASAGIANGFTVSYVVNRMCNAAGNPSSIFAADGTTPMICSRSASGSDTGSTRTGAYYGNFALTGGTQVFYRITTRVSGPRNTVRFTQTFVVL